MAKLAATLDCVEPNVLPHTTFRKEHRTELHSIDPIDRLSGEIKRRTDVVSIFPNDDAMPGIVGALLSGPNDKWPVQRACYMTLKSVDRPNDDPHTILLGAARRSAWRCQTAR